MSWLFKGSPASAIHCRACWRLPFTTLSVFSFAGSVIPLRVPLYYPLKVSQEVVWQLDDESARELNRNDGPVFSVDIVRTCLVLASWKVAIQGTVNNRKNGEKRRSEAVSRNCTSPPQIFKRYSSTPLRSPDFDTTPVS